MELKYVGAMPLVSDKGVSFDKARSDKYTSLNAVVELLEALEFGATETTQHLHTTSSKEYNGSELLESLKKYCPSLDEVFSACQDKTDEIIKDLIQRVHDNKVILEEGRTAWLNNIDMMTDYYYQYVMNEAAYNCALDVLGQEVHDARLQEVTFPMFRNYGLVLHDLDYVMRHRKSPIDSVLSIEKSNDGAITGKLTITHR